MLNKQTKNNEEKLAPLNIGIDDIIMIITDM